MKIILLGVGKDKEDYLKEGIENYIKRIKKYVSFEYKILPNLKKTSKLDVRTIKQQEAEKFFAAMPQEAYIILLDEKGKQNSSVDFADDLQRLMVNGTKNLVFVIGGAYGFGESMYKKSNGLLSLSKMTFNHQLVRVVFLEQLYRAFTIINNEPYHNQ